MKRTDLAIRIFLVFVLGLGLAAIGRAGPGAKPATPAKPEVTIDNFSFSPQILTVPAGTTVIWTNRDDVPHTVVSEDGKFRSHALDTDDKFSYTFTQPGTYSYYCSVHPRMTAKVVVTGGKT
jgi:plastocyanin